MKGKQAEIICIFGKRGSGKSYLAKQMVKGLGRCVVVDPKREYRGGQVVSHPLELYRAIRGKQSFTAIYRPPYGVDVREHFPWLCKTALHVGNLWFVVDELPKCVDMRKSPREWDELVNEGRHALVRIVAMAQRPQRVSRDLTENANKLYVFRTNEPRTLKYYGDFMDASAIEKVRTLPDHTPFLWAD
ncbi:MAG: hypothetical protein M0Z38_08400 [Deltaproteobacteria bacterium]|nr:hypothetical protein [Deltaproteobacteria bacterium]